MTEIKSNTIMYSTVFEKNVEIVTVYKNTVTVRVSVCGLNEGKLITFRGQNKDTLQTRRR